MRKRITTVLMFTGFSGLIYTGINYLNNTESFGFLGADYVISSGDPTGVVVAGGVLTLGLVLSYLRT